MRIDDLEPVGGFSLLCERMVVKMAKKKKKRRMGY